MQFLEGGGDEKDRKLSTKPKGPEKIEKQVRGKIEKQVRGKIEKQVRGKIEKQFQIKREKIRKRFKNFTAKKIMLR
jgi:hypothetical protein